MFQDIAQMTGVEWAVVALATAVCVVGSLLPKLGNLLGRLFLGEDPLLARWKQARLERREKAKAALLQKREARKTKKLQARSPAQPKKGTAPR